jgi:signal transduction histidine kinase
VRDLSNALAVLRAIARAGQEERALAEMLMRICEEVRDGLGFDRVGIARLLPDEESVVPAALTGWDEEALSVRVTLAESPLLMEAYRMQKLAFVADARSEQAVPAELVERYAVRSAFVLPLVSAGRCLGFLGGDRAGVPFELDPTEVDVLETVGALAATLLEKGLIEDELRRLDDARARFVAFAAHELRTPIMTVYGMLATVHHRGAELSDEQLVELRSSAFQQAARLRTLAEQLLDLSRLDASALTVSPQPIAIRRAVEETVLLVAERDAGAIEISIPHDLELDVDSIVLDRIVGNLVVNALRHGESPVAVTAEQRDSHFRLRVTDHGPGIPDEFTPALFDRFVRGSSVQADGSGLGLAIAQAYARAHGGELVYTPVDPCGACFEFVLPLERA